MLKIITGVDLVYLQPFRRNSVLNYAVQPKIAKNLVKTLIFRFKVVQKVIDVKKFKKLVKQHICTYLQPFSHQTSQYRQNNVF